jgi:RimJ/RimL family protein N-acetyltransferase
MSMENLTLRKPRYADIPALHGLYNDPEVSVIYPREKHTMAVRKLISEAKKNHRERGYGLYVVELAGEGVIGDCGLVIREMNGRDSVELIFHLLPAYRGKGYATESCRRALTLAFGRGDLLHINAVVKKDNTDSEQVLERLGFERINEIQFLEEHFYLFSLTADQFKAESSS